MLKNTNLYNDKELFDDGDLNWYDYGFRNYDPQIGRFTQLDPLTDDYPLLTPYQYASNDPITNIDLDGLEGVSSTGLTDVMVSGVRHLALASGPSLLSISGNFLKGLGQSGLSTLTSLGNAIIDPLTTASAIGHAIANPVQTGKAIYSAAKNTYNEFQNGDANTRANILGNLTGDIAQAFIGTGEVKAAASALEAAKFERALLKFVTKTENVAAKEGQTIIGEGMKRVSMEATKRSGSVILNDMPKFTGTADQVTSQMMTYNRKWILQQMRSGRPVLDIGLDATRSNPSIFYQMEQNMMRNYLKLHPNAFKIIKP